MSESSAAPNSAALAPVVTQAIAAVGPFTSKQGYGLDPARHAEQMADPVAAAPLIAILNSAPAVEASAAHSANDRRAMQRQAAYKDQAVAIAWLGFLAIICAALQLLFVSGDADYALIDALGVVQLVLILLTLGFSVWMRFRTPLAKWKEARAEAESTRLQLFAAVLEAKPAAADDPAATLALKLEYVRRFLLEDQLHYFTGKGGAQHRRAALLGAARLFGSILILLAIAAALLLGPGRVVFAEQPELASFYDALSPALVDTAYAANLFLFLSTLGAGVQGLALAFVFIHFDERNATAFAEMHATLTEMAGAPLRRARAAAAANDAAKVELFFVEIREILMSEHNTWRMAVEFAQRHRSKI